MLEERIINLINAELDGELSAAERDELESVLEVSAEARAMRAELQKLGEMMDSLPRRQPPAGLADQIMTSVRLPEPRRPFSLSGLLTSFQPAQAGLAFAAGLLLAVGYYELSPSQQASGDSARMVGTLIAGKSNGEATRVESLDIHEPGIEGTVTLREDGSFTIIDFDLDSGKLAEVEISFAGAGLSFGGIAHTSDGPSTAGQSYEVSRGTLRVVHQGRQAFSVFLRNAVSGNGGGQGISIGISSGGVQRFNGVLRG
jgi:hypothetical protein